MFLAKVHITLRKSILDPQGKAVHRSLRSLGLKEVSDVRIGKLVELSIEAASRSDAERIAQDACRKLLANLVMEDFSCVIEEAKDARSA
jgi:phosphoribosylformylglycinamidine synthase PurS subunit